MIFFLPVCCEFPLHGALAAWLPASFTAIAVTFMHSCNSMTPNVQR